MIEIDWKKFIGIEPEVLSHQEKEDLYETVAWFNPDNNISKKYLIHFIHVTQEILKFKNEQLDSLTNELDEMATKQGAEESNKLQQFRDEMEQLQEELDWYRRQDKSKNTDIYSSDEELKQKLTKLKNENKELLAELSEKEKDLVIEKKEVERYAGLLATAEREKEELTKELKTLQEEGTEKSLRSLKNSPESEEKNNESLTELIKQKNKHISQLLEDIELVEEENWSLRNKISAIKEELTETTTNISEITEELSKLKQLNKEYEFRESDLKEKINSLMYQIEELVEEKERHDKQLDEYVSTFNSKIEEWKDVLESKDEEILKLKEEIKNVYSSADVFSNADIAGIDSSKKVMQQNEQIQVLQQELQKATEEINASAELIEKLKEKQMKAIALSGPDKTVISIFEEKIRVLEEKLKYAEDDAHMKAEESFKLIVQLREYESKTFGLSEAVAKIKKLEKIIHKKDIQIEKLVDVCNNFELTLNGLEEENLALREKMGLSAADEVDTSGVLLKFQKNDESVKNLRKELDAKEEELIKVKLMYRKIMTHTENFPYGQSGRDDFVMATKDTEIEDEKGDEKVNIKMNLILKENDALRKGMHEILESIREQNSLGAVEVQSTCLERLLEALDSRHISGWYHPAMRLQAQLSTEEGKNDELRKQIRFLKAEERKKASELQNAYLKIQSLENEFSVLPPEVEIKDEKDVAVREETVEKNENYMEPVMQIKKSSIYTVQEKRIIEAESELFKFRVKYNTKMTEIDKREKMYVDEKEELISKIEALQCELNLLRNEKPEWGDIGETRAQVVVLNRKVNYLKRSEIEWKENFEKTRLEFIDEEEKMLLDILKLQNDKVELINEIEELEKALIDTVPLETFTNVKKELSLVMSKYKSVISQSLIFGDEENEQISKTETVLEEEKQQLSEELKNTKEKLVIAEALIREETVTKGDFTQEISLLANNLAASEVRELNEKQKSNHLGKLNDALKTQLKDLEQRNKDLLEKVVKLTEENFKYQEVERELRNKETKLFLTEESSDSKVVIENLEKKIQKLTRERENLEELLEISQSQCKAFQEWKNEEKMLLAIQKEEILRLQASSEDKANISRLSHELATAKLRSTDLTKKNDDLKIKVTKLLTKILLLENQVSENRGQLFQLKKKHLTQVRYLCEAMNEVRNIYGCDFTFNDLEDVYDKKTELIRRRKVLMKEAKAFKVQQQECLLKKGEMETQLESLEDLKNALKGDAKNLVSWHNKNAALRLKETKLRRHNEFLVEEVCQLRRSVDRLNEEIEILEEKNLEQERRWQEKRRFWEETQLHLCQILRENGIDTNPNRIEVKNQRDAETNTVTFLPVESPVKESATEVVTEATEDSPKKAENEVPIICEETVDEPDTELELIIEETSYKEKIEQGEQDALKMTIDSLQSVIEQKEATILRYQDLLKEERDEYGKAYAKLELEVKALNEKLVVQGKAYGKLKGSARGNTINADNISVTVEKYLTKIQELEEELRDCHLTLSSISTQAHLNQKEVDKWRALAAERLMQLDDLKQRTDADHQLELDTYRQEVKNYQSEIDKLKKTLELRDRDLEKKSPKGGGENFQERDEEKPVFVQRSQSFEKCRKPKQDQTAREIEALKKQLKSAKSESTRLREQIRVLEARPPRRPRTAGSGLTRSDGCLTTKIKNLEELLILSKEREKELMELTEKKLKSAEEVARWDEKKRNEQLVKNLTGKLKEKEAEVEMLTNKNESFRNMVHKSERDKTILESQLKTLRGNLNQLNAKIEKLKQEKDGAEERVKIVENKLEEQKRHSTGVGVALLHEKLESQERKLVAYELASKGSASLVEDIEKLQLANSNLEKLNLRLESENLCLRLKLEKEKIDSKSSIRSDDTNGQSLKDHHLEKSCCSKKCRKLMGEDVAQTESKPSSGYSLKLKKDHEKLKEDHERLKEKYSDSLKKIAILEDELMSYKYQIHLMEEKDFAQVITNVSDRNHCELSEKVEELKNELDHKNRLLSRVKVLLVKAAAKEKALRNEMTFLQASSS